MTGPIQPRAERDAAYRTAFTLLEGTGGRTALEIQRMLGDTSRETVRTTLEQFVHHRVLVVEREPRNNRYRPAPNWEAQYDDFIAARDARLRGQPAPVAAEDDDEPAPGVPLVLLARQNLHPLQTVWGARP